MIRIRYVEYGFIVIVILFAMFLRGVGIGNFGRLDEASSPSYAANAMLHIQAPVHPDEYLLVTTPVDMLLHGRLNPTFFEYPSGLMYLNYVVFGLTGSEIPIELAPRQGENLRTYAPFSYYFIGRVWSVLGGVMTIACAYSIMRIVSGRFAAIAASLLVATSYISVQHAHYAKPGVVSSGLMMLALWTAIMALYTKQDKTRYWMYIFGGIFTGAAATVRYNAVSISIILFFVGLILLYRHRTFQTLFMIVLSWCFIPIVFFLGTPFAALDFAGFYAGFTYIVGQFLTTGQNILPEIIVSPTEGFGILFSYLVIYGLGGVGFFYFLIGLYGAWRNRPLQLLKTNSELLFISLISIFLLAYMMVTMRTIRPISSDNLLILIVPQCLLLASLGANWLYHQFPLSKILTAPMIIVASVCIPLALSIPVLVTLAETDSRNKMQEWIYDYIPTNSSFLLIEPYNVPLDTTLYSYDQNFNIMNFRLEDSKDYDYLILSITRLDLLADADSIVTDEEYAPWNEQFQLIDSSFLRVAWIDRPQFITANEMMNLARYWHQPSLILYCLNEDACRAVDVYGIE